MDDSFFVVYSGLKKLIMEILLNAYWDGGSFPVLQILVYMK